MTKPFPLIAVAGSAFECGVQHGRQAGERIALGLELYRRDFERRGIAWSAALQLAEAYAPHIERFGRDTMHEMAGIAEGAEQPPGAVILLNARTEITFSNTALGEIAESGADECTAALALPEATGGHTLHGQNWDWRPGCADTSIVLRVEPASGPAILTFCEAGQLARHGMNSAGVAITANGLQCEQDGNPRGIPTPIIRRQMLMCQSYSQAIGVLLNAERSFSHHILVSYCDSAGDSAGVGLEATPHNVYWLRPEAGILTHANHFKHPAALAQRKDISLLRHPESLHRDWRAEQILRRAASGVTTDTFKQVFADRFDAPNAICRSPAQRADGGVSATVASLIMDTTERRLWLAPAPYEGARYTEYTFDSGPAQ